MEQPITFDSAGLKLTGILNIPDDLQPGERRPAFLVLHGFGSNKASGGCMWPAQALADWGYVTLRFDFRGLRRQRGRTRPHHLPGTGGRHASGGHLSAKP